MSCISPVEFPLATISQTENFIVINHSNKVEAAAMTATTLPFSQGTDSDFLKVRLSLVSLETK